MSHATQGRLPHRARAGTREDVSAPGPGWHCGLATDATAGHRRGPGRKPPRARQIMLH